MPPKLELHYTARSVHERFKMTSIYSDSTDPSVCVRCDLWETMDAVELSNQMNILLTNMDRAQQLSAHTEVGLDVLLAMQHAYNDLLQLLSSVGQK